MRTTEEELQSFNQFVHEHLQSGEHSIDELFDEWRSINPADEDVRAIAASLRDLDNGVQGEELEDFINNFRKRHGLD